MKNNLIGEKFGRLTVLSLDEKRATNGARLWNCICSCDNQQIIKVTTDKLKNGHTKSCGCLQRESVIARNKNNAKYSDEDRKSRLYRIWKGMFARVIYKSQDSYKNYGGRGIKICDEWYDFINFKNWAITNGYDDTLSIDRINTNGNYEPLNCCWATRKEQNNNQRSNIIIEYNGIKHTAAQWADIMKISHDCIYKRIRRKKEVAQILKEYINSLEE